MAMKIRVDSPIHRVARVAGHALTGAVVGAQVGMPGIGGFIGGFSNALTQANEVGKKWAENSEEVDSPKRHSALNDKQNWNGR
jgi:hypothetical protein